MILPNALAFILLILTIIILDLEIFKKFIQALTANNIITIFHNPKSDWDNIKKSFKKDIDINDKMKYKNAMFIGLQ